MDVDAAERTGELAAEPADRRELVRPASEVWAEIWDDIGPRIQTVVSTGKAT